MASYPGVVVSTWSRIRIIRSMYFIPFPTLTLTIGIVRSIVTFVIVLVVLWFTLKNTYIDMYSEILAGLDIRFLAASFAFCVPLYRYNDIYM